MNLGVGSSNLPGRTISPLRFAVDVAIIRLLRSRMRQTRVLVVYIYGNSLA